MTDLTRPDAPAPTPVVVNPGMNPTPPAPPRRPRPAGPLGYLAVAVVGAVIGIAGVAAIAGGIPGLGASATPSPLPTPSAPPAGNEIGRPDAPVTMEIWADYQCPFCRLQDLLFGGAVEREYVLPGIVRVVYRDFAFLGQESIDAAVATRCAGAQDPAAQLRYHDALYTFQQGENQGRFARANLLQVATIAGVPDAAAFTACLDDPAVAKAVADETAEGRAIGISATPVARLSGPGGERELSGFTQSWGPVRDAIEAVRVPAPSPDASGSPPASGTPSPGPASTPGGSGGSPASPGSAPTAPAVPVTPTPSPALSPSGTN